MGINFMRHILPMKDTLHAILISNCSYLCGCANACACSNNLRSCWCSYKELNADLKIESLLCLEWPSGQQNSKHVSIIG